MTEVLKNDAGLLRDMGDGIAGLHLSTDRAFGAQTFDFIRHSLEKTLGGFQGLVIGNDTAQFSPDISVQQILTACEEENWLELCDLNRLGQQVLMAVKQAPFPVIGAPAGEISGGGCEILLHCDAIQMHASCRAGFPNIKYGLLPTWGGCKELLIRHLRHAVDPPSQLQACERTFALLGDALVAASAGEFSDMIAHPDNFGITVNRDQLLGDAKKRCTALAPRYKPREQETVALPQAAVRDILQNEIDNRMATGRATRVEELMWRHLAYILSGGSDDPRALGELELRVIEDRMNDSQTSDKIDEWYLLNLEYDVFMALIKNEAIQETIKGAL